MNDDHGLHPHLVADLELRVVDAGRDRLSPLAVAVPLDVDSPLGVQVQCFGAISGVHGDASPSRHEADDVVARQRIAAAPEANEYTGKPRHEDPGFVLWALLPPEQAAQTTGSRRGPQMEPRLSFARTDLAILKSGS